MALYGALLAFAAACSNRRRPVIYTQYSSDLPFNNSNEDQERWWPKYGLDGGI